MSEAQLDEFERFTDAGDEPARNLHGPGFISAVGKGLYPDSVRDGTYGISANTDTVEIGLPCPPGSTAARGRTKELLVRGESVPFLMFSRDALLGLAGQSSITASKTVAGWLEAAWGPPSVLRS
jgi:hypothetical protein